MRLLVQVKTSSEIGALGSLLSKADWPALYRRQLTYALYAIPAAAFAALQKYAATNAAIAMRANLTAALHERYEEAASLPAALAQVEGVAGGDESVARGLADLDAYCTSAVSLFEALFKPAAEVVLISTKLAMMMGPSQLLGCAAFFGVAGSWTRMVAPAFATLAADVQAADAALLSHRTRLHTHAEEVTLLRGAPCERALMDEAARSSRAAAAQLALQRFVSDVLDTYVLRYVGILAAFTAMLPAVTGGAAPLGEAAQDPTKYFLTCLHLLVQVGLALKDLVLSHKALATTRGLATRVHELLDALESCVASPSASSLSSEGVLLELQDVSVCTPSGKPLIDSLNLQVSRGQRVLVRGPNGAGKSSLVRVLGGVWPLGKGSGEIRWGVPPDARLVLPQRTYLLPNLTLRDNLVYPELPGAAEHQGRASAPQPTDTDLLALLQRMGLSRLVPNGATDLDQPAACDGLSPGERQRLALVRMFVRRPAFAVLDEPCAAVPPGFEDAFFAECAAANMSLLTVAHREELSQHHTHELRLDGSGGAQLVAISSKA